MDARLTSLMPLHYDINITLHHLICCARCLLQLCRLLGFVSGALYPAGCGLADDDSGGGTPSLGGCELANGDLVNADVLAPAVLRLAVRSLSAIQSGDRAPKKDAAV